MTGLPVECSRNDGDSPAVTGILSPRAKAGFSAGHHNYFFPAAARASRYPLKTAAPRNGTVATYTIAIAVPQSPYTLPRIGRVAQFGTIYQYTNASAATEAARMMSHTYAGSGGSSSGMREGWDGRADMGCEKTGTVAICGTDNGTGTKRRGSPRLLNFGGTFVNDCFGN